MSDKSINQNNNHPPAEWQPLIPEQDRSYQAAMSKKNASGALKKKEIFEPLYTGNETLAAKNGFEPIYTYQKKQVSSSPAKPDLPENNDVETDSSSAEHIQADAIEKKQKEAYDQGFSQGKKDGYEAGMQEAKQVVENMSHVMSSIDDLWHRMVARYENEMIELVKRISEKVIYGQTQIDNEIVKRAILKSFELIPDPTEATINVSAEDYEFIETAKEDLFEKIKSLKNVSIVSDPSLTRGGCRVETKAGEVDSDIQNRLDAISKSIIDAANEIAEDQ